MAESQATLQGAHPRRRSFTCAQKEQIKTAFTKYAGQGLNLVAIMFRLHNDKIADVSEGLLRKWNDDWKIAVSPRHRCHPHDEETIYPYFKQLYSSSKLTLDDIVFILYDRLQVETTKSSLLKMRNKWGLERRYRPHVQDAQGATTRHNRGASTVQISQARSLTVTGTIPLDPMGNSTIYDDNDDWEGDGEPGDVDSAEDQDIDDLFLTLTARDSASATNGNWLNEEIAQEPSMGIGDFYPGNMAEYGSQYRTYPPRYTNEPDLAGSDRDNGDLNNDGIAVGTSGNNTYTDLTDVGSHCISTSELQQPANRDFGYFDDTPSSGLALMSMHEHKMIHLVREYLFWVKHKNKCLDADSLRQLKQATFHSPDHSDEWMFYGRGFNASQSSISSTPARRQQAQNEWRETKKLAISALGRPTARLIVCILLFYTNAYIREARDLHKNNFQVLYQLAYEHIGANNPLPDLLKHLAKHLAGPNMSAAGTEIIAMSFLADFLIKDPSFDFNSKYEAQELCISTQRNNGNLSEAKRRCDELIAFSIRHAPPGDPAPLRRAIRRKGRILRDQNYLDQAWEEFMRVQKAWESDGKPCSMSKEYTVFEDLAKICRQKGELARAAEYFRLAAAFSDLFDFPNNRSDASRIIELSDLMGKAYISMDESGGGTQTTTTTTQLDQAAELSPWTTDFNKKLYLAREVTRW